MEQVTQWFVWLCTATGAVALFAAVLWALGWAIVYAFKYLKVWRVLMLAVGVKLHGRDYAERVFWAAITEHIDGNPFAAKVVADFAKRCAPFIEETSP